MTDEAPTIGWIGFCEIGTSICNRLRAAGYDVTALVGGDDVANAGKRDMKSVATLSGLAAEAEIIISHVGDDKALLDIVMGSGGLLECLRYGHIFVDTSTVSPEASELVADMLATRGVAYVRAPACGSRERAQAGQMTVIVSGAPLDCERLQPLFATFAARQLVVGKEDESRYMKLALNAMEGAMSAVVAEAVAFCRKGGVGTETMLEVLNASPVASPLLTAKTETMVNGDYSPDVKVRQMMKDLDLLLSVGRDVHCPLPLAAQIRQQYELAYNAGEGDSDFFVLTRQALLHAGRPAGEG
ncbi:NAD(P)-dependent oxidoreductase [Rhizobium sp. KVB221]|uniref:NAD(P)-dependent oxidoreductase n=1 Tax=Rhizobium setariae TaxID=2801340 RepID=A0A936YLV9_9HYPH|nr:NAD(P)-dependent oxidoreductase [Rhizobium setariae]MBL0371132.1 NAD(P)-dependent oxidoreductase [Rhizobium setariae]